MKSGHNTVQQIYWSWSFEMKPGPGFEKYTISSTRYIESGRRCYLPDCTKLRFSWGMFWYGSWIWVWNVIRVWFRFRAFLQLNRFDNLGGVHWILNHECIEGSFMSPAKSRLSGHVRNLFIHPWIKELNLIVEHKNLWCFDFNELSLEFSGCKICASWGQLI